MSDPCDDWGIALLRQGVREHVRAHHPEWTEENRDAMREKLFRINPALRDIKRTDPGDPCDEQRRSA